MPTLDPGTREREREIKIIYLQIILLCHSLSRWQPSPAALLGMKYATDIYVTSAVWIERVTIPAKYLNICKKMF